MIKWLKEFYKFMSPKYQSLSFEYFTKVQPRFTPGTRTWDLLHDIVNRERAQYHEVLKSFLQYSPNIQQFKKHGEVDSKTDMSPTWNNGFLPGLDMVALYGMIATHKPATFFEIGSGNSTKVARRCITDLGLPTKIVSLDPQPRAEIDAIVDVVHRCSVEDYGGLLELTSALQEHDILFIDNSHRVLPNSDALVCFLEIIPFLNPGVIVHVHDIYLPYDYPEVMCQRFYNEQYFLAAFLVSNPDYFKILLPNFFISEDAALSRVIEPMWDHENLKGVERHGGSFWFQILERP